MDNKPKNSKKPNGQSAAITLFAAVLVFFINLSYALGGTQNVIPSAAYWAICIIMIVIAAVSVRTLIKALKK